MLSKIEESLLKELLAQIVYPEQALSYHELMGFMYGLVITPATIKPEEWVNAFFTDDADSVSREFEPKGLVPILIQIYEAFVDRKKRDNLHFPYQMETMVEEKLEEVMLWCSGFEEALALRPEVWEPEESETTGFSKRAQQELFFSLMIVQGINDPVEIVPFFDQIPDDLFIETFPADSQDSDDREMQIQSFLLSTLPLAVQTIEKHAAWYEKEHGFSTGHSSDDGSSLIAGAAPHGKKARIIRVDFTKGKKGL